MNASQPQETPMPDGDLREMAKLMFEHTQEQINFADTKIQLILAADALFASTLAISGRDLAASIFAPAIPLLARISAILFVLMILALAISAIYAVNGVRPRLRVSGVRETLYYSGMIIHHTEAEFIDQFLHQTEDEAVRALLSQVYARSVISQRKFRAMQLSLDFLVAGFVLWAVAQVLQALAG